MRQKGAQFSQVNLRAVNEELAVLCTFNDFHAAANSL